MTSGKPVDMPRTLPWMVQQEPSRTPSPRRSVDSPKPTHKRARVSEIQLGSEKEAAPSSSKKQKAQVPSEHSLFHYIYTIADGTAHVGTPPTSPPPEHLPEVYGNWPPRQARANLFI